MYQILTKCPVCGGETEVTRIYCPNCDTTVEGHFHATANPFAALTPEQVQFILTFVRCEGRFNRMEEEMKLSYPTLRNRLYEIIRALGYEVRESGRAGGNLRLRLYWLAKRKMSRNYTVYINVLGRNGQRIGGIDTYPGGGNYPTSIWLPGDVIVDDYTIPIAADAVAPTAASIRVGAYDEPGENSLPAIDARGENIGSSIEVTRVRVGPAIAADYDLQRPLDANLDNKVMLIGYDLDPTTPTPGSSWQVTLYWRAQSRMSRDYTVFVHLIDAQGNLIAQRDEQPLQGEYPTQFWQVGEKISDSHRLELPRTLPGGIYNLRVGLYDLETGDRLIVAELDPPLNYVDLGSFAIR